MITQLHILNKRLELKVYSKSSRKNMRLYIFRNNYNGNNNI